MTRILHGIARFACPPRDRRWVDALFVESASIESRGEKAVWLLGALGFIVNRHAVSVTAAVSPLTVVLLLVTAVFGLLAVTEYEGLAFEDDWYGAIAASLGVCLVAVAGHNIKRQSREPGL